MYKTCLLVAERQDNGGCQGPWANFTCFPIPGKQPENTQKRNILIEIQLGCSPQQAVTLSRLLILGSKWGA